MATRPGRKPNPDIDAGQKFGRLTIIERAPNGEGNTQLRLKCRCDCGGVVTAFAGNLRRGRTLSCGCFHAEATSAASLTHGATVARPYPPEYEAWCGMIKRCYNVKNKSYPDYGGRGIRVCGRWKDSYENFLADMGRKPSAEHSIDRFPDNDGDYAPGNCRWATKAEQANNRRPRSSPSAGTALGR